MKFLLLTSILLLMACSKNGAQGGSCNPNDGTTQYNSSTVSLIDGTCTMTTQSLWQNPAYIEYTVCNVDYVTQNGIVCQASPDSISSTTTGCVPMADGYQVVGNNPMNPTEQCWFNITDGKINDSTPPTF